MPARAGPPRHEPARSPAECPHRLILIQAATSVTQGAARGQRLESPASDFSALADRVWLVPAPVSTGDIRPSAP
ncbi:protein of unknown function [Rhodovastum atsumiense]|nr:protein of unknown function [Rhodovastum atsumiense]